MAFIEPMHRNKPNITYLLTSNFDAWVKFILDSLMQFEITEKGHYKHGINQRGNYYVYERDHDNIHSHAVFCDQQSDSKYIVSVAHSNQYPKELHNQPENKEELYPIQ